MGNFTLSSNHLGGQATIEEEFNDWGANGKNKSPQLEWKDAPKGTKSFAVTMYDPDAPTGSGWWHWLIFNIPSDCTTLLSNAGNIELDKAPPQAVQSLNDYGLKGYGGPCPPEGHGLHAYIVTVHALKVDLLDLDENANAAVVGFNIWANTLGKASLVFYHQR